MREDLLEIIEVHVRCTQCAAFYTLPASVVAESQRLLECGCPGSDYECPARLFATLLDPDALRALGDAWSTVVESARGRGEQLALTIRPSLTVEVGSPEKRGGTQ